MSALSWSCVCPRKTLTFIHGALKIDLVTSWAGVCLTKYSPSKMGRLKLIWQHVVFLILALFPSDILSFQFCTSWARVFLMKYTGSSDFCLFAALLLKIQHLCIKDTKAQLQILRYGILVLLDCACFIFGPHFKSCKRSSDISWKSLVCHSLVFVCWFCNQINQTWLPVPFQTGRSTL